MCVFVFLFLFVFVFVFSGWREFVVVIIFVSECRRIVERGRSGADNDDGHSYDCFCFDDGGGTGGDYY